MSDEATHWWGCDSVHPDCHHPAERVLRGLIEEQRELHHRMGFACSLCVTEWPCQCVESLDRAESRLEGLNDV